MQKLLSTLIISIVFFSCSNLNKKGSGEDKSAVSEDSNLYLVQTKFGDMKIKLYDETPKHRDNFKKLVAEGFYDSTLFHRVIDGFMIQGGDPDSKGAPKGKQLGMGNVGYTIEAEIVDTFFHKKGALAAARLGDQMNPERRSSGSQFYIVHGTVVDTNNLKFVENQVNQSVSQQIAMEIFKDTTNKELVMKYQIFNQQRNMDSLRYYGGIIQQMINSKMAGRRFEFSNEAKKVYSTIGGAPHLDNQYTVFGEVVDGLNIVDSIAKVQKDQFDRPVEDVIMTIKKL